MLAAIAIPSWSASWLQQQVTVTARSLSRRAAIARTPPQLLQVLDPDDDDAGLRVTSSEEMDAFRAQLMRQMGSQMGGSGADLVEEEVVVEGEEADCDEGLSADLTAATGAGPRRPLGLTSFPLAHELWAGGTESVPRDSILVFPGLASAAECAALVEASTAAAAAHQEACVASSVPFSGYVRLLTAAAAARASDGSPTSEQAVQLMLRPRRYALQPPTLCAACNPGCNPGCSPTHVRHRRRHPHAPQAASPHALQAAHRVPPHATRRQVRRLGRAVRAAAAAAALAARRRDAPGDAEAV